jgi:hypothetical protein
VPSPVHWTDHNGVHWKVPTIIGRLKFRIPCHRALRAYVHRRDGFRCQGCGILAYPLPPPDYDGSGATYAPGRHRVLVLDHILSRRNGGLHHPDNLRTLCEPCNASKACLVDARSVQSA